MVRRMLSPKIIDSDAFLDMPVSSQNLYFHLVMRADDEGFVGSPKKIMKILGSSDDDFKVLVAKRFILVFESGVIVIKHWLIHNAIRLDRFNPTTYQKERKLIITNENKAYTEWQPNGNQMAHQLNLTKLNLSTEQSSDSKEKTMKTLNLDTGEYEEEPKKSHKREDVIRLAKLFDKMASEYSKKPIATPKSYFIVLNAMKPPHNLTTEGIEKLYKDWFNKDKVKDENKVKLNFALSADNINAFKVLN